MKLDLSTGVAGVMILGNIILMFTLFGFVQKAQKEADKKSQVEKYADDNNQLKFDVETLKSIQKINVAVIAFSMLGVGFMVGALAKDSTSASKLYIILSGLFYFITFVLAIIINNSVLENKGTHALNSAKGVIAMLVFSTIIQALEAAGYGKKAGAALKGTRFSSLA